MSTEFALILIKPDAWERGLDSEILSGLKSEGLSVIKIGTIQLYPQLVLEFYQWPSFYDPDAIRDYICIEPLPIWITRGNGAITKAMALKNQLRAKYCKGSMRNLFHCSSSQEESQREFNLLKERYVPMKNPKKRTRNQVEAIVFRKLAGGEPSFLMLKRAPERGAFWQPVTGNVEEAESFEVAALREVQEELGITNIIQLIDTGYSYEFTDNGLDQFERIFGVQVPTDQVVRLSSEHTEYCWATKEEALNLYLKYPGNKEGLRRLYDKVAGDSGAKEGPNEQLR